MKDNTIGWLFFFSTICIGIAGMLIGIFTQHILGLLLIMTSAFFGLILLNIPVKDYKKPCKDR